MNKNDKPISNVDGSFSLEEFDFVDRFVKISTLKPLISKEKIEADIIYDKRYSSRRGIVYVFVIDGKVVKIGSSTTSMKARIQSYNCGKQAYRDSGTCSTTNYFVLQSFLKINKPIDVYGFFPESIVVDVFGVDEEVSIPPKIYEKNILKHLKEEDKLPVLCTQT